MMGMRRLIGVAAAVAALTFGAAEAKIPCSTAKLIVPWGAGGGTDVIYRIVADIANKQGSKPKLQVVNVPGQGGNKGAKQAKAAKPNGCTLFAIHQSAITSYYTGRVDFDWSAFAPVALMTRTPPIIGANPSVPYNDLKGLVAAAKAKPNSILAGVTLGSTSHFWFLLLADAADVSFKYVPYDGTRERMTALLANNIQLGEINLAAAKKYIQSKQLKALGIYTEKRNSAISDVPTAKELGFDLVGGTDRGVVLPKGAPQDAVAYWTNVMAKVAKSAEFNKAMNAKGSLVVFKGGADYRKYMDDTNSTWSRVAKKVGIYKRK